MLCMAAGRIWHIYLRLAEVCLGLRSCEGATVCGTFAVTDGWRGKGGVGIASLLLSERLASEAGSVLPLSGTS